MAEQNPPGFPGGFVSVSLAEFGGRLHLRLGQMFYVGVLDQFLGTDGSTQTALDALGVIDPGNVVCNGDGAVGTDLLAQTTADTTHSAGTGGSCALGHGVAGNDHIAAGLHRDDQLTGACSGTGHTAYAQILVNNGHTVFHGDGAVLTGFGAGAIAQTAVLTDQRAGTADFGSCHAVLEAFVVALDLGALRQVAMGIVLSDTGTADQSHSGGSNIG